MYDVDPNGILTLDTIPISQTVSITQNLPAQNPSWTPEDVGLGNVPTFAIRQQYYQVIIMDRFILLLMEEGCINLVLLFLEIMRV